MEINHINNRAFNYDVQNREMPKPKVRPSVGASIGGIVLGSAAKKGIETVAKMPNERIMNTIQNMCRENSDSFEHISNAVNQALKDKGVLDKGVKILDVTTKQGAEAIEGILKDELSGNKLLTKLPDKAKDVASLVLEATFSSGSNAAYLPNTKTVVLAGDKMGLTVFHEAGHSINANASKVGSFLQKLRPTSLLAGPIALIAILKRPKMEGEKPEGAIDKATTFIKKHAGKLTFATFLPMLIEEGMASIRGCKIAKGVSPEVFKATCKVNGLAYLTYLGVAIAAGIGVTVARNIRDKIAINSMKKKQAQAQEQMAKVQAQFNNIEYRAA